MKDQQHRKRMAWIVVIGVSVLAMATGRAGGDVGSISGLQIQSVSDTAGASVEITYSSPPLLNDDGTVTYVALMDDFSGAIRGGVPRLDGSYETFTIARTGSNGQFSAVTGENSLGDGNHVSFGASGPQGLAGAWGGIVNTSSSPPIVATVNLDNASSGRAVYRSFSTTDSGDTYFLANEPSAGLMPGIYRAFDGAAGFQIQNVSTSSQNVSIVFSAYANNQGDVVVTGEKDLGGGSTQGALVVVSPLDPSRDVTVALVGDALGGGRTVDGFVGSAVISSDRTVVTAVNLDNGQQALVRYEATESSGNTVYVPLALADRMSAGSFTQFTRPSISDSGDLVTVQVEVQNLGGQPQVHLSHLARIFHTK